MDGDKLFSDVKFVLAKCNNPEEVKNVLIHGGAKQLNYISEYMTHVVADFVCPEVQDAELYDKPAVNTLWVHLCLKVNQLLPVEAFCPMRSIFNNVIVSFSRDLSPTDVEILAATITYYGGKLTKKLDASTHFIAASSNSSELKGKAQEKCKIVAPDWISDSVKQKNCCDELLYAPSLLRSPPPPTPTPPPPSHVEVPEPVPKNEKGVAVGEPTETARPNVPDSIETNKSKINIPIETSDPTHSAQQQQQNKQQFQLQNQHSHHQEPIPQPIQMLPSSQLPRQRHPTTIIRSVQPRFRPILPQNANIPASPRHPPHHQPRITGPDSQQLGKATINYNNSYRKISPYQSNDSDPQTQAQTQQQMGPYQQQPQQQMPMSQSGTVGNQQNRLTQPNVYHHVRTLYQNSHMGPRVNVNQSSMLNQAQQPSQMMNRFQDPNSHMSSQRPYQNCVQPQPTNANYQQGNMNRQPIYYTHNSNMPVRIPQAPSIRTPIQSDQSNHESISHTHQLQENIQNQPHQHYHNPNQTYQHHLQAPNQAQQPQFQQQQSQQPQPNIVMQHRSQYQSTLPASPMVHQIRGARSAVGHQDLRVVNVRPSNPSHPISMPVLPARITSNQQSQQLLQPHPSIFNHKHESSLSQIRAKVPVLVERVHYYGHDPKETVPADLPFYGCRLKLFEYDDTSDSLRAKWCNAMREAGAQFCDRLEEATHLICETRLTTTFSDAMKQGVRCVTIYWVNDILKDDYHSFPWKALHFPLTFSKDSRPLHDQIISITNLKGRERREVKEMILKTGAKFTEYFSQENTLLICGEPGGDKYERAIEWKTPIANCHLLSDFLIGVTSDLKTLLLSAKYRIFNRGDPLRLESYNSVRDIMLPWTCPIPAPKKENCDEKALINGKPDGSAQLVPDQAVDSEVSRSVSGNDDDGLNVKPVIELHATINGQQNKEENLTTDVDRSQSGAATVVSVVESDDIDSKDLSEKKAGEAVKQETRDASMPSSEAPASSRFSSAEENNCNDRGTKDKSEDDKDRKILESDLPVALPVDNKRPRSLRKSLEPIRLLFTHLDRTLATQLESFSSKLGLEFASSPIDCTHLIVDCICRTPKFICAFSHASYILSYDWIIESHKEGGLLDEKQFILQDVEGEEKYSFNLIYSLLKRKKRSGLLFKNLIFFVTPSVLADVANLNEMIESAGGVVATRKPPTKLQLNQMTTDGKRFVVVTNQRDLHLCSMIESFGVDLVTVEFVISGILRQDIDFEAHRIVSRSLAIVAKTGSTESPLPSDRDIQPSPKKMRLD